MKQHSKLFVNLIFAAVILAAAGVLFALRAAHTTPGSTLEAELIYGDANTVHIEVKDGAARFVDSPCPDHICEGYGWLSAEDQSATCLPARAVLTIVPLS